MTDRYPSFVLFVHRAPDQVARLARTLAAGSGRIFVHVDHKYEQGPFEEAIGQGHSRIQFLQERTDVRWGAFSTVVGMLRCMREAAQREPGSSHVVLMSGQCYPIKPVGEIDDFYRRRAGQQILSVLSVRNEWTEAQKRYARYYFNDWPQPAGALAARVATKMLRQRTFPRGWEPYGGSMYVSLTPDCVEDLAHLHERNRTLNRFFAHMNIPDELYFQTLIMNSERRHEVLNWSPWLIKFPPRSANPHVLTAADFDDLRSTDRLFARKFDASVDATVFDRIDQELVAG